MLEKIKKLPLKYKMFGAWGIIIVILILVIIIRSSLADFDSGNDEILKSIDEITKVVKPTLTEEELVELRVAEEKIEEKQMSKKQKSYKNEILTEETAMRLIPGQERSVAVYLNNKGTATVKVKSKDKDVVVCEGDTLEINEENCMSQFVRFKVKVAEEATVNKKVAVELSAKDLPTEKVIVTIEDKPKDTENIEMYFDMVPGMTFSSDFICSLVTKQEEKTLKHTAEIKNYAKDVLIKKDGEIRAWNVGDAVVTLTYEGQSYKIYVRVREEVIYPEPNKKETSIHFMNPIKEELEVGDEYSLIAITLPYSHTKNNSNYYDKMAYYESSNKDVCTVTYGDVRAEGPGICTITAYNKDRTLSTSIQVKVVKKKEIKYNKVMEITPSKAREYGLSNTDGRSTLRGIIKIVKDAKAQGKNRVYFTESKEYIIEPYDVPEAQDAYLILLESNTEYDFNGTTFNVIEDHIPEGTEWGYQLFTMRGTTHTVLKNINIMGPKHRKGSVVAVSMPEAIECTVEGCNIGYNYWNVGTYSDYYAEDKMKNINAEVFEFGNIRSDGTESDSKCRVRSDYLDLSYIDEDEDFMVGDYTEYGHYGNCPSILYDMAYYDKDKKFIKKESCHGQFFAYYKPKGAQFCRLVFHTEELPKNGDSDTNPHGLYTGYCIKMGHVKRAFKCVYKDNILHNATHVNLVMCGEQRCVIEGNYFYMDGDIGCDIDWEDFFQAKSCDIVRDNVFTTRYDSFACVSGMGYVFRNNAFYHQAYTNITGGTRLFRMFGNIMRNIPSKLENGYDSIYNNNIWGNTFYNFRHETGLETNGVIPRLRVENNTVYYY